MHRPAQSRLLPHRLHCSEPDRARNEPSKQPATDSSCSRTLQSPRWQPCSSSIVIWIARKAPLNVTFLSEMNESIHRTQSSLSYTRAPAHRANRRVHSNGGGLPWLERIVTLALTRLF